MTVVTSFKWYPPCHLKHAQILGNISKTIHRKTQPQVTLQSMNGIIGGY